MNATAAALPVAGIELTKNVFEVAVADGDWRVVERARLSRTQFERWFANRVVGQVAMEACGSAHHWGRWLGAQGIDAQLLPAKYVRAYVKRNKTDAADAAALLEACRASDIVPVRVKSVEQQALQALHRTRSLWMSTRTSRINALRGFCREFGLDIRQGSRIGLEQIGRVLADPRTAIPALLRPTMKELLEEIRLLEARIGQLERELALLARQSLACTRLLTVPGIAPRRLPVVLGRTEVHRIPAAVPERHGLAFRLLYGTGMRKMECLRLRVRVCPAFAAACDTARPPACPATP